MVEHHSSDGSSNVPGRPVAVVALTPAESKRLIAKGVAALPAVRRALESGRVVVTVGSTNACIVAELLGQKVDVRRYLAGLVTPAGLIRTRKEERLPAVILIDGRPVSASVEETVLSFTADDVLIKGANAVDPTGAAGILIGDETGGKTAGRALPIVQARGAHLVMPVGLEKLVPSVVDAARRCGIGRTIHSTGMRVGLMPVTTAVVVTEIEALHLLCNVAACHIASGGIWGGEGSVVLALEGNRTHLDRAFELVRQIKAQTAEGENA